MFAHCLNVKHFYIIIKGFRTIFFIFIVISTSFRSICPPAFFRCLSNSGTFTELRTDSFIESTGVANSDSFSHNRVQVLSIPVLLLACSKKKKNLNMSRREGVLHLRCSRPVPQPQPTWHYIWIIETILIWKSFYFYNSDFKFYFSLISFIYLKKYNCLKKMLIFWLIYWKTNPIKLNLDQKRFMRSAV